ncbi:MAG: aldo/keto reductase [Chloroflexota bacterium]
MQYTAIGETDVRLPSIVFGTTTFGNIFKVVPYEQKLAVLAEMVKEASGAVGIDSAGKYGAGLALECIGDGLRTLGVDAHDVVISNKLAWRRAPLTTPEPTFEPGAWFGLEHDAVLDISYDGILRCWEEGNELLGRGYVTQMVSVHDPDEYLAQANSPAEREQLFEDVLDAYRALAELKVAGKASAIGVGAKDWTSIQEITRHVDLDWVMFANSMTLYSHPAELLAFMDELQQKNVAIINSAVFNAGFLTGGEFFNYRKLDHNNVDDRAIFQWREKFFMLCEQFSVDPAHACYQFGQSHPAIVSMAISTSRPERVAPNIELIETALPDEFWSALKEEGLLDRGYHYVG